MREIKFRAWDKEREEMLPVKKMDFQAWWVSCEPVLDGVVHPLDYGERNSFKNEETDRHILMQYTGLKDRNGKEIYEGDIVKYISRERTGTRVSYKKRGYETFAISSDIEIIGFIKHAIFDTSVNGSVVTYIVETEQVTKYESYFHCEGRRGDRPKINTDSLVKPLSAKREYEVIGNIYENPDLLDCP